MAHRETSLINQMMKMDVCESHHFADNNFVPMESTNNISDVLNMLHNFHSPIKFTYDVETDRCLEFLNDKFIRSFER
jgi:hypothetical protein